MAVELLMPKHGLNMSEGIIAEWLKKSGEEVKKGEILLTVETDKAVLEVESPADGVLGEIMACEGDTVPVGEIVALIEEAAAAPAIVEKVEAEPEPVASAPEQKEIIASPAAKRLAKELGVDLGLVQGSGPNGRIAEADIKAYAEALQKPQEEAAGAVLEVVSEANYLELTKIQKTSAERLAYSFKEIPHFYLGVEVNVEKLRIYKQDLTKVTGFKFSFTDFIIAALAKALKQSPRANGNWEEGKIRLNERVNVAVATATDKGLLVPVIHDADHKSLLELAQKRQELVQKALAGRLSIEEMEGGTFTLTNLGMFDISSFDPIINPPQCAILSAGAITEKVVAVDNKIAITPVLQLRLAVDHRVLDGADAAKFFQIIKRLLENPEQLA